MRSRSNVIAPGKNRIAYLVGHLTTVNDRLFTMLALEASGCIQNSDAPYLDNPDGTHPDPLSLSELKSAWKEVNVKLTSAMETRETTGAAATSYVGIGRGFRERSLAKPVGGGAGAGQGLAQMHVARQCWSSSSFRS